MKKIFSFLCLFMAIVAMSSCSSAKEEKGTSGTGNAALDNIFERKSVRTYLNKGVEKEKIDFLFISSEYPEDSRKQVKAGMVFVIAHRVEIVIVCLGGSAVASGCLAIFNGCRTSVCQDVDAGS